MYILAIFLLLSNFLYATNPKIYMTLGDPIYENIKKIDSLKHISIYEVQKDEIDRYLQEVEKLRQQGVNAERSGSKEEIKNYLKKLRELTKANERFLHSARRNFETSLRTRDNDLFIAIVNSGLIDTELHKEEILRYYNLNLNEESVSGVLASIVEKNSLEKRAKTAKVVNKKSKKMIEEEKIKRFRENNLRAQKKLEERLEDELSKKKQMIRESQKRELRH